MNSDIGTFFSVPNINIPSKVEYSQSTKCNDSELQNLVPMGHA